MVSADIRQRYAEQISANAKVVSAPLLRAFAVIPREEFLGSGPWRIVSKPAAGRSLLEPQITDVSDPAELYRDVAVILDPSRNLANGMPSTLAPWIEALDLAEGKSVFHVGCGTGYFTAVMAELVGPNGHVIAVEVDPALAAHARSNLARYSQVEVIEGDGGIVDSPESDAILINAGVTHPREIWIDSLRPSGGLVLPLTVEFGIPQVGKGMVLNVRRTAHGFSAGFLPLPVMIYTCTSVRNQEFSETLSKEFASDSFNDVRSLRRGPHDQEPNCLWHTASFCLSKVPVPD
jgi:protein-L-isoaspartate(D-aspartate) O-methyltransferase